MSKQYHLFLVGMITLFSHALFSQDSILMFVSYDSTYYSEFIVMYEALTASGYYVDVRSGGSGNANSYLIGGDLVAQANGLSGSSYTEFVAQFQNMFASPWNAALNGDPGVINGVDSIQDVPSMAPYQALIVVGGRGVVDYRIDGSYPAQLGLPASQIESAANKLNALAAEALMAGKPIMGQCHGASIPAFWRVPGTAGNGFDNLGNSLLDGSVATGYPEAATGPNLSNLNIAFRPDDKVVIGTPNPLLNDNGNGTYKILTTRDWYPQTVAHAARTLINVVRTYPSSDDRSEPVSLLIIHGGEVNASDCAPSNQDNDIPCNYGTDPADLPADITDLLALFGSGMYQDNFNFVVHDVNLFETTPFDLNNQSEIQDYLDTFDVIFFYKHWSSQVTDELQHAIVHFADEGGGVVSIHHGLYNQNKNILVNDLFQAHSPASGWSANRTTYQIFQTNYGHFVSSFMLNNDNASSAPGVWTGNPPLAGSNLSLSLYPNFTLFDELYNNMQFVGGATFGEGINEITPIFSNNQSPSSQCHVHGFVKLFDMDEDGNIGRIVFGQARETKQNYQYPHPYAQFIRNAVVWAKGTRSCSPETVTWIGGSGDWLNDNNWTSGEIPTSCSQVVIPDQGAETEISLPISNEILIRLLDIGLNVNLEIPLGTIFQVTGEP
ncbi:MAG: hypothetical protein KDC80_03755 [Saprospiraceae bacterium]|nr:hypothetical protein [Saprospiraceae bacterium]